MSRTPLLDTMLKAMGCDCDSDVGYVCPPCRVREEIDVLTERLDDLLNAEDCGPR